VDDKEEGVEGTASEDGGDGLLLDLYRFCQCSVFMVCSALIPGILISELLNEPVRKRAEITIPDQSGRDSAILALDTPIKYTSSSTFHTNTHPPLGSWKTFSGKTRRAHIGLGNSFVN